MNRTEYLMQHAKDKFGHITTGLKQLKWEDVPEPIRAHIDEDPGFVAALFVLLFALFALVCLVNRDSAEWDRWQVRLPIHRRKSTAQFRSRLGCSVLPVHLQSPEDVLLVGTFYK